LHISKSKWDTYRQITQDEINLSIQLEEHKNIELETNNLLNLLQHAAKLATPNKTINNIPYEIKKLLAEKRRASLI